ncbi:MAG: 50S ribosomal protein L24 [Gemmatimonadaceae bacterium]
MRVLKHRKAGKKRLVARHAENAKRLRLHVSKGDTVRVMRGEDKGKEGKIIRINLQTGRVVVEGVNIVKMHRKARTAEEQSGIREAAAPVHSSNLMLLDPKSGEPTRTKARFDTETSRVERRRTKERVSVKHGEPIPRVR